MDQSNWCSCDSRFSSGLAAKNSLANEVSEENQAVKRQKLDYGKARQVSKFCLYLILSP